jgi:hypothetical protein
MLQSTRRKIYYPNPDRSDISDVPAHIKYLVDALEVDPVYVQGTNADRLLAVHMAGVIWYATDTQLHWWDTGTTWVQLGGAPAIVTDMNTVSPLDQQEIRYLVDATNGIIWNLKYRAASASAYKWEFIGGPPLISEIAAAETTTSTTYAALTTSGPNVVIPRAGDYIVAIGSLHNQAAAGAAMTYHSYDIGATTAVDADATQHDQQAAGGNPNRSHLWRAKLKTGLTAGITLTSKYRTTSAISISFEQRAMHVSPVRIS